MRNGFKDYRLVISLESFGIKRTDENQFQYHEYMKNLDELANLTDSLRKDFKTTSLNVASTSRQFYSYQFKDNMSLKQKNIAGGKWVDSLLAKQKVARPELVQTAMSQAQSILNYASSNVTYLEEKEKGVWRYQHESHHKFTSVGIHLYYVPHWGIDGGHHQKKVDLAYRYLSPLCSSSSCTY